MKFAPTGLFTSHGWPGWKLGRGGGRAGRLHSGLAGKVPPKVGVAQPGPGARLSPPPAGPGSHVSTAGDVLVFVQSLKLIRPPTESSGSVAGVPGTVAGRMTVWSLVVSPLTFWMVSPGAP